MQRVLISLWRLKPMLKLFLTDIGTLIFLSEKTEAPLAVFVLQNFMMKTEYSSQILKQD